MSRKFCAAPRPISAGINSWRYFNYYTDKICFDESDEREFIMRSSVCLTPTSNVRALLWRHGGAAFSDADHQLFLDRALSSGFKVDNKTAARYAIMTLVPGGELGGEWYAESILFFNQFA